MTRSVQNSPIDTTRFRLLRTSRASHLRGPECLTAGSGSGDNKRRVPSPDQVGQWFGDSPSPLVFLEGDRDATLVWAAVHSTKPTLAVAAHEYWARKREVIIARLQE